MTTISDSNRIVSGMRTTGKLHLGNYHGALKNWIKLQHEYDCFFFAADWHALTTDYEHTREIPEKTWNMIEDWLAAGLNPGLCKIFIQSMVPEHAELYVLLSMITPLRWLERVPTYKDQQEKIKDRDLSTYGFLGYPTLQAADVLLYKANLVPVGGDQVPHIELIREISRRFNHLYGKGPGFATLAEQAIVKMGKKNSKLFCHLMKLYQERGNQEALAKGKALLESQANLGIADRERLSGYLEGSGKTILSDPVALLTETPTMPGLDGRKMSKSYNNTIELREKPEVVAARIKVMPTDPARIKRTDPGTPEKCRIWDFHKIYSNAEVQAWAYKGCTTAGIGCLDCKAPIIDAINNELAPIREKLKEYSQNRSLVANIVQEGTEQAREVAKATLADVREAMGMAY